MCMVLSKGRTSDRALLREVYILGFDKGNQQRKRSRVEEKWGIKLVQRHEQNNNKVPKASLQRYVFRWDLKEEKETASHTCWVSSSRHRTQSRICS